MALPSISELNNYVPNTLMATLGIVYTQVGEQFMEAEMEVDSRHLQPMGFLHGGATIALAESVGSLASVLFADPDHFYIFGTQINATHVNTVQSGRIIARAEIIHQGKSMHVWEVKVRDTKGKLISVVTVSNTIKPKR